jgi:hypothetical protein
MTLLSGWAKPPDPGLRPAGQVAVAVLVVESKAFGVLAPVASTGASPCVQ